MIHDFLAIPSFECNEDEMFDEIYNYLTSIGVRQLMSTLANKYHNASLHWKLFGCMFNQGGICIPESDISDDCSLKLHVITGRDFFTPLQLDFLVKFANNVIVFSGDLKTDASFVIIYNAFRNLAAKEAILENLKHTSILLGPLCHLIEEYCYLQSPVYCVRFLEVSDSFIENYNQLIERLTPAQETRKKAKLAF